MSSLFPLITAKEGIAAQGIHENFLPANHQLLDSVGILNVSIWQWLILGILVAFLIAVDLWGHVRKAKEPTFKESAIWTGFYVSLALLFGGFLAWEYSRDFAIEYLAGYLTEYSLSLDNIFVFIIVIAAFRVPRRYQQKVLMWGIVIALVLRLLFILLGAALISNFVWVFFLFGLWMLYTAITQIIDGIREQREGTEGEGEEFKDNLLTRLARRVFNVTEEYEGASLVVRRHKKVWITPLMLCILAIGSIDLMFALDSIPAIFGLTKQPFIVFAANAFALLGLRQLFFIVDGLLDKLVYLHFGIAAILGFIAFKLILHAAHGYNYFEFCPEPNITFSVSFIVVTVLITVFASVIKVRCDSRRSRKEK